MLRTRDIALRVQVLTLPSRQREASGDYGTRESLVSGSKLFSFVLDSRGCGKIRLSLVELVQMPFSPLLE